MNAVVTYFQTYGGEYWQEVGQHLLLSGLALAISLVIALPLGYWGSKQPRVAAVCTAFSQLLRIVPSLALLFLLIPLLGTGLVPTLVALVALALPPLLVNTVLGFTQVDPTLKEVGVALGMDARQLRRQVELPLALPYLLNGVKLALVEIIASASLAAYIGAGGLGVLIFTGLGLYNLTYVTIGGGSVALLSLATMVGFDLLIKKVKANGPGN